MPSVAHCGAVPWVPSNEVQRGNGIGETHEEGGCFHFKELQQKHITTALIIKKHLRLQVLFRFLLIIFLLFAETFDKSAETAFSAVEHIYETVESTLVDNTH